MQQRLQNLAPSLSSDIKDNSHECQMSIELYQNARQTMGELRDNMRELGISWDFIQHQIDLANHSASSVDNALRSIDEYSTGLGKSLHDLPSNIW